MSSFRFFAFKGTEEVENPDLRLFPPLEFDALAFQAEGFSLRVFPAQGVWLLNGKPLRLMFEGSSLLEQKPERLRQYKRGRSFLGKEARHHLREFVLESYYPEYSLALTYSFEDKSFKIELFPTMGRCGRVDVLLGEDRIACYKI